LQEKDSFKTTFHRCLLTDRLGRGDYDFVRLAKMQPKLTFDLRFLSPDFRMQWFETPFKEIMFTTIQQRINPGWKYLLKNQPIYPLGIKEFTQKLVDGIKEYLKENLKKEEKYLFLHSGGYDSRVISSCMRDLWEEGMRFDIHFRCHQPEEPMFLEIMKRQGWPKDMYSVFTGQPDNYYSIGHKENYLNGWHNYNQSMNFWSDIAKNEKEYTLITGLGGELFKYIALHSREYYPIRCENININILLQFNPDEGQWDGLYIRKFKDLLMPLFGYSYMKTSLMVVPGWCKFNGQTDSVRIELTRRFKYGITDIPYGRHNYSWNLSDKFFEGMLKDFYASRFYKDFGKHITIQLDFTNLSSWAAKLWGFMTTYDKIYE